MTPSEAQLALIYETVSDEIILMTVDDGGADFGALTIASVNAAFCRVMRLKPDDVVGKRFNEAFPPAPQPVSRYREMCGEALREKRVVRYEEHIEYQGRRISAQVTLTPIVDEKSGKCTHLLSTSRDITAEAKALELLRLQHEHAPEAIITLDLDQGRYVDANPAALALFGRTREELLAAAPGTLSAQPEPATPAPAPNGNAGDTVDIATRVQRALAGTAQQYEWNALTKNGRVVPCEVRLVRLPGPARLLRASIVDISDRRRADELRRLSAALLEEARLAQASSRVKSELVANMSHELRTPMNAILGFTELMHDGRIGTVTAQQRECLADILKSGRHLLQLINGMLDLARVDAGRMELAPVRVAVRPIVVDAVDVVRALAERKRIEVHVDVDPGLTEVVIDPLRLKQVLFNFLSNAIKFTPDGGRIAVKLAPDGPTADGAAAAASGSALFRVEVEDTGAGIHERDLPRLFVEFSQLDSGPAKRHEGTGLGLALTKRIVEAQGGSVGVRSVPGKGSTFYALLPRAPPSPLPAHETPSPSSSAAAGAAHGK